MPLSRFQSALLGQPLSHVWRGFGSALFLEFGALGAPGLRRNGSPGEPSGDVSLMVEWSWRIEGPRSILGGSWSSERRWPGLFDRLRGAKVTSVRTFGSVPEIEVALSNGLRVASFMTAEGQPHWALVSRTPPLGTLCVRRGRLVVEPSSLGTPRAMRPTGPTPGG